MTAAPSASGPDRRYTGVIMAGSRRGANDGLAQAAGLSHKCLIEIAGRPMLLRVLETLESCPHIGRIVLCIEQAFDNPGFLAQRIEDGTLERLDAAASPAASAARACATLGAHSPLLIVTADHPLLNLAMLDHFCTRAHAAGDVAVAVARAATVFASYPRATRTLLKFSDGPYCGCNLFAFNTPAAQPLAAFWERLEADRKRPWRLVRMLGLRALANYLCGRLTLEKAITGISTRIGVSAMAIEMPFAEAAIDVDKPADLALVQSIIESTAPQHRV